MHRTWINFYCTIDYHCMEQCLPCIGCFGLLGCWGLGICTRRVWVHWSTNAVLNMNAHECIHKTQWYSTHTRQRLFSMYKEPKEGCNEYPSNKNEHKRQQASNNTSNNGTCMCDTYVGEQCDNHQCMHISIIICIIQLYYCIWSYSERVFNTYKVH